MKMLIPSEMAENQTLNVSTYLSEVKTAKNTNQSKIISKEETKNFFPALYLYRLTVKLLFLLRILNILSILWKEKQLF